MESHAIVASLLLTFVAYGSTTFIFDSRHNGYSLGDLTGRQPLNADSGMTFSQELTYDRSNSDADSEFNYKGAVECAPGTPQCKILKLVNSGRDAQKPHQSESNEKIGLADDDGDRDDDYRSDGLRSGRSVESHVSGEEDYAAPRDDGAAFGPATLGWNMVRRMAAVERVVAEEHRRNGGGGGGGGNLLDVEPAVPVKKSAVKVTKHGYVSFRDAGIGNLKASGRLEYLSVDAAKGTVYAECSFDRLVAAGAFKTNLRHTTAGSFVVQMDRVVSNVTASFHKGRAAIAPAVAGAVATRVAAADRRDADALEAAVDRRYRGVLGHAVSAEVYNSTHKGLVARLKAETSAPFGGGSAGPFDVDWTEGELNVRAFAADGGYGGRWHGRAAPRAIESVSYTRVRDDAYRMRFDVALDALGWTGDLTAARRGRGFRAPAADFHLDRVKVRVVVVKSAADGRTCRKVETDVHAHGFRYAFNERSPDDGGDDDDDVKRAVERELPGFVKRSFEAQLRNSVSREMCDGQVDEQ